MPSDTGTHRGMGTHLRLEKSVSELERHGYIGAADNGGNLDGDGGAVVGAEAEPDPRGRLGGGDAHEDRPSGLEAARQEVGVVEAGEGAQDGGAPAYTRSRDERS